MLSSIANYLGLTSLYQYLFPEAETSDYAKETPKKRIMHSPPSSPPTAKKPRASCSERSSNAFSSSQTQRYFSIHSLNQAERNMFQQRTTHQLQARPMRPDQQAKPTRPTRPNHQARPTKLNHQARPMGPDRASGTSYSSSVSTPSQQSATSIRTKLAEFMGSWQPAGGYLSSGGTPLLIFYDCESTGGSIHDDHIIEIAAEVVGPEKAFVTTKSFSELCFTSRIIGGIGCGVNKSMLVGTREFSYVFLDFLSWINNCVIEVKKTYAKPFYPVLVAHNGFNFDYRILAAEIERQKLTAQFIKADLGFADTLYELRKMRKADDSTLSEWSPEEQRRLSMDSLHRKCFPNETCCRTHRALEDVQMMIKIFISSNHFSDILQSLTIRSVTQIITDWKKAHEEFLVQNQARSLYGAGTSKAMAKCLKQNGLSYEILQEMFRRCPSLESFDNITRDSGVKHKTWRQQLWEHFSQH